VPTTGNYAESRFVDGAPTLRQQFRILFYVIKSIRSHLLVIMRQYNDSVKPSGLLLLVTPNRVTYSDNGWMDEIVMLKYLSWLHEVFNGHPCGLVMDSFPAHYRPQVRYKPRSLAIEIIPVPRGLIGKYQPLDRRPFGVLKRESQRLWDEMAARQPGLQWNHVEAAKLVETAGRIGD
jgi:hypothetical protein